MTFYQKLIRKANKVEKRYPNDYLLLNLKSFRVIARAKSPFNRKFVKRARQTESYIVLSGRNLQTKYSYPIT